MTTILSLVWYKVYPPRFGGQKGIAHFNRHLAKHAELVCLCSGDNSTDESYRVLNDLPSGQRHVINPFYWSVVKRTAKETNASIIILEHPYHGIAAWLAARANNARLVVHSHNIESDRFRQIGKWWWPLLRAYEKWTHRRASLSLFKTETDLEWAVRHFGLDPEKCLVIPYGVEVPLVDDAAAAAIRRQYDIRPDEKLLLFAGTLDYEPNAKAVEDIFRQLAPALRQQGFAYKILVCGRNRFPAFHYLNKLKDPSVIIAGEVASIDPYFAAADVFINPVLSGGGIQTKNLDAIAHGCNTVCFRSQATGIPAGICGDKLSVVDDGNWEEFVRAIAGSAAVKTSTRSAFFSYFDWERILQPLIHNLHLHD